MLNRLCPALIAVALTLPVPSAIASPVTFNLTGTATSSTVPGFAVGQTVTGQVTFDLALATNASGSNWFEYHGAITNMAIGGFITSGGNGSAQILVRGLGPTLGQPPFNVTGVLADPFLQLFDGNGTLLYSNNDWKDSQQAQIQATGMAPPNNLESAILRTVAPGNYTAILSGRNSTTGIGLVEVYKLK